MKLHKKDKIKIIAGKDKGRTGLVEKVYPKQEKVLILGINLYKKHIKKSEKTPKGGVVEIPRPIDISKIMLICPKCDKTTRIGYQIEKKISKKVQGKKFRICKKCKSKI